MRHQGWRKMGSTLVCVMSLCLALVASAGAAEYPPDGASRSFENGASGWTSSSSFDGSCIPPLLCPTVTNSFVPVGGADNDGYITAAFTGVVGVGAVAGTSTSVWESPQFTYRGGSSVALTLSRRASVDQLLAVEGNSAEYSVQLVNLSAGGTGPTVVGPSTLAGADTWSPVPATAIKPGQLSPGDDYRIRITTRYSTGTSVLVAGTADYDDVALRTGGSGNGSGGGGKGDGKGSGNGGDLSSRELLSAFSSGLSSTAVVSGANGRAKRLLVKVKCPKKIGSSCRITAQGLLRKRKPVTTKKTVKVASGKSRKVVLKVKPKFSEKVAKRKRLLVSEKVRAGKTTATAYKVRKLIRR